MRVINKYLADMYFHRRNGGVFCCSSCNAVLGFLNPQGYKNMKFWALCNCGQDVYFEIYRHKIPELTKPHRPLYKDEYKYLCQTCEEVAFSINKENVRNFAFNYVCKCGIEYDIPFKR